MLYICIEAMHEPYSELKYCKGFSSQSEQNLVRPPKCAHKKISNKADFKSSTVHTTGSVSGLGTTATSRQPDSKCSHPLSLPVRATPGCICQHQLVTAINYTGDCTLVQQFEQQEHTLNFPREAGHSSYGVCTPHSSCDLKIWGK